MSYNFHITRAESWPESEQLPIERREWEAVADSNSELFRDGYFDWSDIGRQPVYVISGEVISFSWRIGRVDISGVFTDKVMGIAEGLASQLKAAVVGDDE
ncbi:hypothetical protein ADK60_07230 [Streptomyces sp. XY431]|uniref:hypothetical protein n=1 Tax=Streptomyces sp. XY431 TaxID=1415562 RepID=UPI0006AF6D47|nr:hypothetical protein [Streptomyces sp. XY431]KOV36228.1 hypothetical protein ADK60_07230 [Streptomyces sp. XY431]